MSIMKRPRRIMPGLNTAAMPDLVFTVLFFFMIVTHLREVPVKLSFQTPKAHRLDRLAKKSTVSYIYIGRLMDANGMPDKTEGEMLMQLNDKFASPKQIGEYIKQERARMAGEDLTKMTVSIHADRHTPMALIGEVKRQLQQANALRIHYSAQLEREN